MRAVVLIIALVLASCAPPATGGPSRSGAQDASTTQPAKNDTEACVKRGGEMLRVCLMGEFKCVTKYADAGKSCTDKSQCQGACRYYSSAQPGTEVVGECQRTSDPCGCFATVSQGKHMGTLCVD